MQMIRDACTILGGFSSLIVVIVFGSKAVDELKSIFKERK